jgi:glycerol-3-phosphate acyltransferase PlsY
MNAILFLILAYLIGTLSPAYVLGKIVLKKDIRKTGTKTLGATNVFLKVGKIFGILTALFDVVKAFIMLYFAILLNFSPAIIYSAAALVIVGHCFPFYLSFKGGKGVSAAGGSALALLIFGRELPYFNISFAILIFFMILVTYWRLALQYKELKYRKLVRLLLACPVPIILYFSTKWIIIIVSIFLAIFLLVDIARLLSKKLNKILFSKIGLVLKKKEKQRFSAYTFFALSALLTIIFFQKEIAILSITLAIFGDAIAELIGRKFGKIKLVNNRTLEGSTAYLLSAALISLALFNILSLKQIIFILAPLISMLVELLTIKIDDNLTTPFVTALILSLI